MKENVLSGRERRNLDATELPVPSDLLVYSQAQWLSMCGTRFYQTVTQEAVWVYDSINPRTR